VVSAVRLPALGLVPAPAAVVSEAAVRAALGDVVDPEIPTISIVDLGLVHRVELADGAIRVELLPTFVACPALEVIRDAVERRLATFGQPVHVAFTFAVPWSSDRLTAAGRAGLRRAGIAPPSATVRCAYCDSDRVVMDSAFGPTLCRSLHYCRDCRQPFEAFKPV
jgi:ring-1,2-phenylacetyl-CoA epoxidase subunit PaaD